MKKDTKKVFDAIFSNAKVYLIIILFLLIIICILNTKLIIPSLLFYICSIYYSYISSSKGKDELNKTLSNLSFTLDNVAKNVLTNSPLPLVVMENNGHVIWKSSKFMNEFAKTNINQILEDIKNDINFQIKEKIKKENLKNKDIITTIKVKDKTYKAVTKIADYKNKKSKDQFILIIYFIDESENYKMQNEYEASKTCVGIIMVDNYEDIMLSLDEQSKINLFSQIDKQIYNWTDISQGVVLKTEKDKYIWFFEQRYLEKIKEDKLSILDKIKEIQLDKNNQITLSIAITNQGDTDKEKFKQAQNGMDIVLGRGGDQGVIEENKTYKFFGGRLEEVEKRTKVKARVVSHALEKLIEESKNVIIMGHTNPDMDAIGSSLGVYAIAKAYDKNVYIVKEKSSSLQEFEKELEKEKNKAYQDVFISKEVAQDIITNETLLVVVDTHKKSYVDCPELLAKTKKVVVIDHHRRSQDFIDNPVLVFHEVYASSASELVTEILQYTNKQIELTQFETEALYAGIMMDTKNFTFKTGVRTFEVAAYLRKCGVDIIRVKKLFQTNFKDFTKISKIVNSANIYCDSIAIAINEEESELTSIQNAKAADELLTISDITASFVIGEFNNKVYISARSIGDINVQVILEKLGGGRHLTLAGAQIEDMTIDEAKELLIEKINEYTSENVLVTK